MTIFTTPVMAVVVDGESLPRPSERYIGTWRGATAIAIGERYVLTAAHVGGVVGNNFKMDGRLYQGVAIHPHPQADLQIIEVQDPLPGFHRIGDSINAGDPVIIGGMGYTDESAAPNGYYWTDQRSENWGRNEIEFSYPSFMAIRFDQNAGPAEANFALYDSGGGIFVEEPDGELVLVGMAVSIDSEMGFTAWGNRGYAVNMTFPQHRGFLKKIQSGQNADGPLAAGDGSRTPNADPQTATDSSSTPTVRVRTVTGGAPQSADASGDDGSVRTVRPKRGN